MEAKLAELETCLIDTPLGSLKLQAIAGRLTSAIFQENTVPTVIPSGILQQAAAQFAEYFMGKRRDFDLPILQSGTAFQQKVWQQLLLIPYGETISYMMLAKQLGNTKTIRAAASANGKNNLAIIVPCHRVIGSNGTLTGYAGGLWRKQWLLHHELQQSGKTLQGQLF